VIYNLKLVFRHLPSKNFTCFCFRNLCYVDRFVENQFRSIIVDFLLQEEQDSRKCLNEGKDVSLCAIDFFRQVRDTCNDTFTTFWTCLDNARKGEMSFN
jgi:hypothetical protein